MNSGKEQKGFLNLLFNDELVLDRRDFVSTVMSQYCNWIFSDEAIRKRMKRIEKQWGPKLHINDYKSTSFIIDNHDKVVDEIQRAIANQSVTEIPVHNATTKEGQHQIPFQNCYFSE